jgi:hypothetical protein
MEKQDVTTGTVKSFNFASHGNFAHSLARSVQAPLGEFGQKIQ